MSTKDAKENPKWELTGAWAGRWKMFAAIGVIGILASGFGFTVDPRRFAFSWMFAFVTVLTIALGALFFVLVQHATSAGWSVTVRRTAEFFATGLIALVPLFIPILMTMGHLFPWLGGVHVEKHGEEHGSRITLISEAHAQEPAAAPSGEGAAEPGDHKATAPGNRLLRGHGGDRHTANAATAAAPPPGEDPFEVIEKDLLEKKTWWLSKNLFLFRAALYFFIWGVLAMRLFGYSTQQDRSKNPELTVKAHTFSHPALVLFALSLTGAAFDWIMSLEPTWFSTIFGVVIFACGVVSSYAVLILTTLALRSAGPLKGAVTVEHFHDLGKLMFGFLVFWAYVGFSQFMLIWYAALPEETTFFHNRYDWAPWDKITWALILGHFVIPFFWTISRNFKRNLGRLQVGAAIILFMHVIDMYWFVMPNFKLAQDGFTFHWLDVTCLMAVGGIYAAFVFYRMTKFSLVPIGDPRLERSLHFQNA